MDLNFSAKRKSAVCLLLGAGCMGYFPLEVIANSSPIPLRDIVQQRNPSKRTIVGTIVDAATGEALMGVNIRIRGTSQGTVTDLDGKFTLDISNQDVQLEVTYIGYKDQLVDVADLGVVNIKMESAHELIDEVVVVGAGTQKKVSVTGAITSVKGMTLKAPSSSLTHSLAGKLAGVISTSSSGEPGAASNFYIRGINTFGGTATPLILLDGVEISAGDLNRIPAESIESFSLLKDASATAIYGNRGANGVMLVTTKRGSENSKTTINVSLEASYFQPMSLIDFADGATYMELYNEAAQTRSLTPIVPKYSEEQIANTRNHVNPYAFPDVDWYDLLFRNGNFNQRANVNVSGGSQRVTYYMSLQANHDTGLIDAPSDYYYNPNFNNWQYNFQNNISYKLTNTTTVDLRMMAQIGNQKGPNYSTSDLYQSVMSANPVSFPAYFPAQEDDQHIRFGSELVKPGMYGTNPYEYMMRSFKETNYNMLNTSLVLSQDFGFITKGLSARVLVNFKNWSQSNYDRSITSYFYKMKDGSFNPETGEYELELLRQGADFVSQSGIIKSADQTFYLDARADWKRSFGAHNVTAMFMYMMREYRVSELPNRNQGYSGRLTYIMTTATSWSSTSVTTVPNAWRRKADSSSSPLHR